ncbi:hypothetical protein PHMEG_00016356 [Phytophthora megakarya]|uniref:Uncharacterized protein n=1 Tax=Phytophthora megakarya TaxID=4795 RepID=A0A225VZI2_9STRA|nr:hypothetical protein PHMEG_00016356 [Phytophthora megakarya]
MLMPMQYSLAHIPPQPQPNLPKMPLKWHWQGFSLCVLPFMLIEAKIFRDFIAVVAPAMKPPSRHKHSGVLLNRVRDEMRHGVINLINKFMCPWDLNSSSIINFVVIVPGMPSVFWSSWSTRSELHTTVYLAGEIDKIIAEIEH